MNPTAPASGKRRVGIPTVARSDFNYLEPVLEAMADDPGLEPFLIVAGTHLSGFYGRTVDLIEAAGHRVGARVECTMASDSPLAVAESMALATAGFGRVFAAHPLDALLILGDRYEMLAIAAAAVPFRLPIVHLHGGEETTGAIDNVFRHGISKLAMWHGAANEDYARRLRQMGEADDRVMVTGAPALDLIARVPRGTRAELAERVGRPGALDGPFLVCTFHPETVDPDHARDQAEAVLDALAGTGMPVVWTMPNADPGGAAVRAALAARAAGDDRLIPVENLGARWYYTALSHAAALVGNSSSGIIEAPSFGLPTVNVGGRQAGRVRGANVVDVAPDADAVAAGLARALDPAFRAAAEAAPNPYGDGRAAPRIVELVRRAVRHGGVAKAFVDRPFPEAGAAGDPA